MATHAAGAHGCCETRPSPRIATHAAGAHDCCETRPSPRMATHAAGAHGCCETPPSPLQPPLAALPLHQRRPYPRGCRTASHRHAGTLFEPSLSRRPRKRRVSSTSACPACSGLLHAAEERLLGDAGRRESQAPSLPVLPPAPASAVCVCVMYVYASVCVCATTATITHVLQGLECRTRRRLCGPAPLHDRRQQLGDIGDTRT